MVDLYWPDFDRSNLPDNIGELGQVSTRRLELPGVCGECLEDETMDGEEEFVVSTGYCIGGNRDNLLVAKQRGNIRARGSG